MAVPIIYRTTGPWGPGADHDLLAEEIDANMYALAQSVVALQNDRPEPDNIASISVSGTVMNITLTSGKVLGPIPLPFLRFDWRGAWQPSTSYTPTATFVVDGQGIYFVNLPYTSGPVFDEGVTDAEGNPLLIKLFGFSGETDTTYDVGFCYMGRLADLGSSGYIYQERFLRKVSIPATDFHVSFLQGPAASAMTLPIFVNDTHVADLEFLPGANEGTFSWLVGDLTIDYRDRLAVGLPAAADATAAGLSVGFGATRL